MSASDNSESTGWHDCQCSQNLMQNLSSPPRERFRPRVPSPQWMFTVRVCILPPPHLCPICPNMWVGHSPLGISLPCHTNPTLSCRLPETSWTTPVVVRDLYPGSSARKEEQNFFLFVFLQSLRMLGINRSVVETMDNCPAKKPHKRNLKLIICMKS